MKNENTKIPVWFWIVSIFFLLWNMMGLASFIMQMTISTEALGALPIAERELYESYPLWTKAVFAIAVFGGFIGSLGLVFRKKWAKLAFIASLCGIIPQVIHNIFASKAMEVYGPEAIVMPIMIVVIGIFLLWFSMFGIKKGWLK